MSVSPDESEENIPHGERLIALDIDAVRTELMSQAAIYQKFDFPRELRMSNTEFERVIATLVTPQPEWYKGRFDIPVVVIGTRVLLGRQYEMLGCNWSIPGRNWINDEAYKIPDVPHLVWMQDGTRNIGRSVDNVLSSLAIDERGATLHDGVGLYVARPGILQHHFIDFPGTRSVIEQPYGNIDNAHLDLSLGEPCVGGGSIYPVFSMYGSVTCGK